ncbi:SDR family oxidoreductase [Acetobacteraceae bacterium KSS8]|uniref:SDR family oxidoreductase n=1 Tax=Endosaccharibacter trunci TaxID=2812733 RepID=A0ABT1WAE7_9PROT|nr:SDR family oxidoreductase [Acetobacteraceae bacterium KSS8]
MGYEAIRSGGLALVTGGASGIGLAACRRLAAAGMRVAIADRPGRALEQAVEAVASESGSGAVRGFAADVARRDEVRGMVADVTLWGGRIDVAMANAAIQPGSAIPGDDRRWDDILAVNLHGVIETVRAVLPGMTESDAPGLIIVSGSKQGITTPPGDPAYNVAKAGVKAFTEAVQHHLRNLELCNTSAHLLIPGFVWTGLTRGDRTEKPDAAWTPEQTVGFMMERLQAGDFYILCPDNDVSRATDEKRILWAAGDIVENRPPLSRWHPGHAEAFARFLRG